MCTCGRRRRRRHPSRCQGAGAASSMSVATSARTSCVLLRGPSPKPIPPIEQPAMEELLQSNGSPGSLRHRDACLGIKV